MHRVGRIDPNSFYSIHRNKYLVWLDIQSNDMKVSFPLKSVSLIHREFDEDH